MFCRVLRCIFISPRATSPCGEYRSANDPPPDSAAGLLLVAPPPFGGGLLLAYRRGDLRGRGGRQLLRLAAELGNQSGEICGDAEKSDTQNKVRQAAARRKAVTQGMETASWRDAGTVLSVSTLCSFGEWEFALTMRTVTLSKKK